MNIKTPVSFSWLFKMAWRDSRKSRSRLLLFISSIIIGIAALVAISSFSENLQKDIDRQAKTMIGADMIINSNSAVSDSMVSFIERQKGEKARENSFASMVLFPKTDGTRLVQIRALEGDFPFYGEIESTPAEAARKFQQGKNALVDQTLMLQFEAQVGDSIRVGTQSFLIVGALNKVPGQNGIAASVAPPVYIPMEYLSETGLVQKGSRVSYKFYFKLNEAVDIEAETERLEKTLKKEDLWITTIESTKRNLGRSFENLAQFLNLVAFVALLLGCVGVASAIQIYVREKMGTVAILRCMGLKGKHAFYIYLIQIMIIGLIGSLIGAGLGAVIQSILPEVLKDFLPIDISLGISWFSILKGLVVGLCISLLFALLPLAGIGKTPPLKTLRVSAEPEKLRFDFWRIAIVIGIILAIFFFYYWQIGNLIESVLFTIGIVICFLILIGVAKIITWAIRKFFPSSWPYTWRQSLANLYRPNNQTAILIVSIGLGTALISMLYFIQGLLIDQINFTTKGEQPNMVLFDIQTQQSDDVNDLAMLHDLNVLQQVPIVTMKIAEINGRNRAELNKDTTLNIRRNSLNWEYRTTYRDHLIDSEEISEGEWVGNVTDDGIVNISIEDGMAKRLKLTTGDTVVFNVQGTHISTIVASTRKVDWNRVQTNFMVLFPSGILEEAPQFHVMVARVASNEVSAQFQSALVQKFPNVSVVDLALILKTVDSILDKIAFVIRFMALFSIITGFVVLIGSVVLSKFQRIRESVLFTHYWGQQKADY